MTGLARPSRSMTTRRGDDGLAHLASRAQGEFEAGHLQIALDDLDDLFLGGLVADDELGRAVAARADALAAEHVGLDRRVGQHPVEHRCGELRGAGGRQVAVERLLRAAHERAEALGIARAQRLYGLADDGRVDRSEVSLDAALRPVVGEGVALVEALEDLLGVLARAEVHDDEEEVLRRAEFLHVESVAVEGHQDGPVAVGAALVHAPAARRGGDLAQVGGLHLAAHGHLQVVHPVESPRHQHAQRRARGEPLADGQVGQVVVDLQAPDAIVQQDLVGDAGRVTEEPPLLGLGQEGLALHGQFERPPPRAVGKRRGEDQLVGMGPHLGVKALVGAGDERVALLEVGVDAPVAAGPVAVLAEEADAPRHEDSHRWPPSRVPDPPR